MGKNKDPAVLFYPSDFLASTSLWTNEQLGMYIKLLCLQFLQDGVSNEDIETVCGDCTKVKEKFVLCDDGSYRNPRMALEKEKRIKFTESRRANINKRYERCKATTSEELENIICATSVEHMKNICSTSVLHMGNENININKDISNVYGLYRNILLTDEELKALKAEFPNDWQQRIEKLSEYIASSGKVYDSHLATIRIWAKADEEKQKAAEKDKPRHGNFDPNEAFEAALKRSYGEV
jgi:hypothetical protein